MMLDDELYDVKEQLGFGSCAPGELDITDMGFIEHRVFRSIEF